MPASEQPTRLWPGSSINFQHTGRFEPGSRRKKGRQRCTPIKFSKHGAGSSMVSNPLFR